MECSHVGCVDSRCSLAGDLDAERSRPFAGLGSLELRNIETCILILREANDSKNSEETCSHLTAAAFFLLYLFGERERDGDFREAEESRDEGRDGGDRDLDRRSSLEIDDLEDRREEEREGEREARR